MSDRIPKLINARPVGTSRGVAHINMGDNPHRFQEVELPIYEKTSVGLRLRAMRKALGLNLMEASRRVGIRPSEVLGLESGRLHPASPEDEIRLFEMLLEPEESAG